MMDDLPELSPAQSIAVMLTLPWSFGDVQDGEASYSEGEITDVLRFVQKLDGQRKTAEQERDAVRADAETLRMEYQRQRDMAISAKALLDAMPDELRQRVADAERIAAELRTYLRRYEEEHRKLLAERDEARAEVERLRELMTDRESDLRYEYLRRVEAEDTIDKVKQALRIAAAGVSAVDTAEQMYAELERLRTAAQDFANVALRYAPTSTGRAWHEAWDVLMDALEV